MALGFKAKSLPHNRNVSKGSKDQTTAMYHPCAGDSRAHVRSAPAGTLGGL